MKPEETSLIFVYNADGGLFNTLTDAAHKIFSPQTYQCNLCALTHSNFGMRREWKEFLKNLKTPFEFLHADEFEAEYDVKDIKLPAVFKKQNNQISVLIDSKTINDCRSLSDFKNLINSEIEDF
jgi:hypothetical protein